MRLKRSRTTRAGSGRRAGAVATSAAGALFTSIFVLHPSEISAGQDPLPAQQPIPVEIVETDEGFALQRGGSPYRIRGAG